MLAFFTVGPRHFNRTPATLVKDVPKGDDWLFETKFDGYRCMAAIAGNEVRLYSRVGHDWSEQFAAVAPPFRTLTEGTALMTARSWPATNHFTHRVQCMGRELQTEFRCS